MTDINSHLTSRLAPEWLQDLSLNLSIQSQLACWRRTRPVDWVALSLPALPSLCYCVYQLDVCYLWQGWSSSGTYTQKTQWHTRDLLVSNLNRIKGCLSVCQTRELWQNEKKTCAKFLYHMKDWSQHQWPWMTLNSVIAFICIISPNSIALHANYVTLVEDRL